MQPVLDWLRGEWFGVTSVIIGSVLSLFFYLRQRQPKTLDYEVVSSLHLLNGKAAHNWMQRLHVRFDNVDVSSPVLVTVRIVNTGKRAVVRDDFVDPIRLGFGGRPFLDVQVTDASSDDLRDQAITMQGIAAHIQVCFSPQLMNAGDWFEVVVLLDGVPDAPTVSSRFADQTRPMRATPVDRLAPAFAEALRAAAPLSMPGVPRSLIDSILRKK